MEQKEKRTRRRSIIRNFCLNTSAHGLPGIARSESIWNRLFWSISFIVFMGVMIYFIIEAIIAYFQYPTSMDVTYAREWPQYFPAVSLCNISPARFDRFLNPLLNYTGVLNHTQTNNKTLAEYPFEMTDIYNLMIEKVNKKEDIQTFFYPLTSMLYRCSFNNQPCSSSDFISFVSSNGLCYTFNAKMNSTMNKSLFSVNEYGGSGKLTLDLYVHSHQYVPAISDSAGIIALVHENDEFPLIESAGLEFGTGRKHRLSYKRKKVYFLSSPYTTCTDEMNPVMKAMLSNYNNTDYGYSEIICTQLCEQAYIYEQCACVNPFLWNARLVIHPETNDIISAPLCNVTYDCYTKALTVLLASSSLKNKYCSYCKEQCTIKDFIIQTSSSRTPLHWQMDSIKKFVENSNIPLPINWSTRWQEEIYDNYLSLSVIHVTNIIEKSTQSGTLNLVDILSNVGGQTGLWIGISFLSLMELLEMLCLLCRHR